MSNIVIYLPYEPLGKQGGMERATHGLAEMLRDAGHRVLLLCREKNRLGETYFAPVPLAFLPTGLSRSGERDYLLKLLREEKTDVLIDQTEGGVTGRWGIFRTRTQMEEAPVKLVAVQHSSQYSALRYYHLVHKRRGAASFSGNTAYEGGALDAYNVAISGNTGTVLFENNSAENAGGAINLQGGGSISLTADQADIIFRGNTVQDGSVYNAIHFNDGAMASFNAADNRRILFEDGLSSQDESVVDISVNDAAGAGGTVAMSGANSQSGIRANTTVYGGTFSVSSGATYGYHSADWSTEETRTSFTVSGGSLHIGEQAALNAADVRLEDGTELSVMGTGSLNADTLTLGNNVSILGTGEGSFSITANAIDISNGITIDLSRGSMISLELHADTLTLGGTLALGDDQVDYTSSIWQRDQSYLVMDASGVTNMDGTFSEILSSLSDSATITVGNLGLEGYDPSLELGRWELRWDEGNALHLDWISNGLVVPEPATSLLLLLAAGGLLAVRKRTI